MIQVPQEVVSTHHGMVRRGTDDPAELAQVLARPDLHPDNATYLEQWRKTLPPYAPCAMSHPHVLRCSLRSPRPDTHSRAMDGSHLRCAALCPPPIFQAGRFRARASTHGYARGVGNSAKHRVSLRRGCHISGLVLRDAERAPRFVGPARGRGPCVATRGRCIAADALDRRFDYRLVVVRRGEAPAGRIGYVCASEGTRERMGCPFADEDLYCTPENMGIPLVSSFVR